MPAFNASPFKTVRQLVPGKTEYSFGSFNTLVSNTLFAVTNVALTSNVATLTVSVRAGSVPVVGALISVQGTATSSGLFNVTNVALTGVTINTATGTGTVTFALTHADVVSTPDAGLAMVPQAEASEALVVGPGREFNIQSTTYFAANTPAITWETEFPSAPATVEVDLEGSLDDINWYKIDSSTIATGEARTVAAGTARVNFVRLNAVTVTGGTSPTIIGKIQI